MPLGRVFRVGPGVLRKCALNRVGETGKFSEFCFLCGLEPKAHPGSYCVS